MDIPNYANVPALAPPPGVVPNFHNPPSRAGEMRIAMGLCIGITSVLVVLRFYVKFAITHTLGWDDCKFFPRKEVFFSANGSRGLPDGLRELPTRFKPTYSNQLDIGTYARSQRRLLQP